MCEALSYLGTVQMKQTRAVEVIHEIIESILMWLNKSKK